MQAQDLTFQRREKLFVISFAGQSKTKSGKKIRNWLCRCDCGNLKTYETTRLNQTAKYVSCGCERKIKFHCMRKFA